jgi:uncharacterized protein YbaP (TraB family)
MTRSIILLLPVFIFQSCRSQQAAPIPTKKDTNTLLWEISGKGLKKPSYMFGTFHLMCKEDIRFSANLLKALQQSKEIYLEMDMDDPANTLGAVFFINMKDGKKLRDLYTAEDYQRLEDFFTDSLNMSLAMFQRMKPNFLEALLYPKMMPCASLSGIEEELMKLAKEQKKEIKGFETIAFQASVFDSIPYEKQAQDLLKTIDSMASYRLNFDTMLLAYKNQQINDFEKMFKEESGFAESKEVLLDRRNKNWVTQLKTILPEKNIFIGVGAGHLVGENGLIALLQKEGFTVKPLENR